VPSESHGVSACQALSLRRGGELPMSGLIRYEGSRHLPRHLDRQLTYNEERALANASEIRAIGFVTKVGMTAVAEVTDLESLLVSRSPLGEARFKLLADTAAAGIAGVIVQMVQ